MIICFLDPSANTGYAFGPPGGTPTFGAHALPKAKLSRVGLALEGWLHSMIKANGIEKVYFEQPVMPRITSFEAMAAMLSKPIVIAMTCERLGIEAIPIPMQTWRSEFGVPTTAPRSMPNKTAPEKTARRKWLKQQTINRCVMLGHEPKSDDEADALGGWFAMTWRVTKREVQPDLLESLQV